MEVSAAVFARMCGVSRAAMTHMKKHSEKLVFNSAGKLDTDNPVNRMYLEQHQAKMKSQLEIRAMEAAVANGGGFGASAVAGELHGSAGGFIPMGAESAGIGADGRPALVDSGGEASRGNATFSGLPQNVGANVNPMTTARVAGDMLNMTVRQLIMRHGSLDNVEKYSKILRDLSAADEREQRTQEKRMLQIPKDFVVQRIFGYVDQLMNQLLDVPEAVCDQVIAVSLAGGDGVRVSVMHILSDSLTKCISGAKEHITGELNALRGKYDRQADMVQEVAQEIERMSEAG